MLHHQTNQFRSEKRDEHGQVLLITVMLLAAVVTVVMTIAFNSTTETQITKMEEDSQKALSAAESALEAAIQSKAGDGTKIALNTLPAFAGSNITGEATIVEMSGNKFVTPILQRDEQYTFYLSNYSAETNAFGSAWTGDMTLYLKSESPAACPALELTFIDIANNVRREVFDPCNTVISMDPGGREKIGSTVAGIYTLKEYNFGYKSNGLTLSSITGMKVVIARVLNASTRIGFETATLSFPSQGRVVSSEAKTASGVTKKIELFQSYPQIPSDFFVTSF